jgi:hypothetical protein
MEQKVVELHNLSRFKRLLAVGDIHGDYSALLCLLKIADLNEDLMVFLGDYADRGKQGIEVIDTITKLSVDHPQNVFLLMGNHEKYTIEGEPTFHPSTLVEEVEDKGLLWQDYFQNILNPFIRRLKLAVIIPQQALFVHGGISTKISSLEDLKYPSEVIEQDILWSDPFEGVGEHPNAKRGGKGVEFGEDVTSMICERLGIKRIIRSHEPRLAMVGPYFSHGNRVVTVSSTGIKGGQPFVFEMNVNDLSDTTVLYLINKQ